MQVDKVLETLLRWMLATEPEDRPDMPAVIGHDWCRKRFPRFESSRIRIRMVMNHDITDDAHAAISSQCQFRTGKAVSAPPHGSDPLLSTTVCFGSNLLSIDPPLRCFHTWRTCTFLLPLEAVLAARNMRAVKR